MLLRLRVSLPWNCLLIASASLSDRRSTLPLLRKARLVAPDPKRGALSLGGGKMDRKDLWVTVHGPELCGLAELFWDERIPAYVLREPVMVVQDGYDVATDDWTDTDVGIDLKAALLRLLIRPFPVASIEVAGAREAEALTVLADVAPKAFRPYSDIRINNRAFEIRGGGLVTWSPEEGWIDARRA